ncbi:MAG: M1 family metallopeptidase, partial [Planctomycetaceae bacterium]|nr:M1 family metallopeptidase [Planctomycetaceae bacterium]
MRYQSVQVFGFTFLMAFCIGLVSAPSLYGQESKNQKFSQEDKFRQLEEILPTPNRERAASGAPGSDYWQQKVDYEIDIRLNDETQELFGKEVITYTNNSK